MDDAAPASERAGGGAQRTAAPTLGVDVCDATDCTLREAIQQANGNDESDNITFDLDEGDRVIELTEGQLTIADEAADSDLLLRSTDT